MRLLAFLLALTLGGCPTPPNPQPDVPPANPGDLPMCVFLSGAPLPVASDVCKGLFTQSSYLPCVRCTSAQGCFDAVDKVYCVKGSCQADNLCQVPPQLKRK